MVNKVKVRPDYQYQNCITVHSNLLKEKQHYLKVMYVRFGHFCNEVEVKASEEIAEDEILLSTAVIERLHLPLQPYYELKFNKREIELGPFIGILACKQQQTLVETVHILSNYVYDYEEIGGAVLAFSIEGMNVDQQVVEGYIYNPDEKSWESGIFPYPKAVFKRTGVNRDLRNHLHSVLGETIFNSYIFNKWEMYQWLHPFPVIKPYLPETILYEKPSDVIWFLKTFKEAMIKPISGSQGVGIIKASKKGKKYTFTYKENDIAIEESFSTERETRKLIRELLKKKGAVIQESIDLLKVDDRVVDFRLLLLKNGNGIWDDFGLIARYGQDGNFISNISGGGSALRGEDVLREILSLSEREVYRFREKIRLVAIDAAKSMEACGIHLGNLGIDIAIDQNLRLWIIEINNKDPNHTIAIDAKDRQMFYRVKRTNMLYAKFLSGF